MGTRNYALAKFTVFVTVLAVLGATAATVTVTNGEDLQAAIDAANANDVIVVRKGIYGPISLDGRADLVIKGEGKPVIDGSTASNCILLNNCGRITVSGFGLKDSQLSGVLRRDCDTVTISKCLVQNAGDEETEFADCE